ncbi:NUDIX hydrolase [Pullulanibacillus sp. KACC 23026]|uniref:NUDIX domain-containing protein n=1 Tax=Pullulanibacillus sp. KACC 23026 TaxID=3028315 RepID=UPI0023AF8DFC|nr:NUDIX hydrolase [Pullulanibacillus sp. KACC 23026]WEG11454.1 NUDIX hydrolase [Pullulanibacillus sp. KACC 23026]
MDHLIEKTLSSKVLFEGRVIDVYFEEVELPNGQTSTREIVKHPGAVAIIPINSKGELLLVRQFRKPLEKILYEIPAGKLEKGEEPESCAYRELEEETGFKALGLEKIAEFYTSPGFADEKIFIYYTNQLEQGQAELDEDEFLDLVPVSLNEAKDMVKDGRIGDAKTVYAVQYLELLELKKQV